MLTEQPQLTNKQKSRGLEEPEKHQLSLPAGGAEQFLFFRQVLLCL